MSIGSMKLRIQMKLREYCNVLSTLSLITFKIFLEDRNTSVAVII